MLQKPHRSGSIYFNYKHSFSIVLMAVADANCKFLYVDVGAEGRTSDAGVYNNCTLSRALENGTLGVPDSEQLPGTDFNCPYMLVGDDAFPLRTYLMKPFPRRGLDKQEVIFNYRLSRARRVVENAFGILANRFRIFRAPMLLQPRTARLVVQAATVLHNFLRDRIISGTRDDDDDDTANSTAVGNDTLHSEGNGLRPLRITTYGRQLKDAKVLRDNLMQYFMGPGSVPWQEDVLNV